MSDLLKNIEIITDASVAHSEANVIKYLVQHGEPEAIIFDWASRQHIDSKKLGETAKVDIAHQAYEYYKKEQPEFARLLLKRADATANIAGFLNQEFKSDLVSTRESENMIDELIEQRRFTDPEADQIGQILGAVENMQRDGKIQEKHLPILGDLISASVAELEISKTAGKMLRSPRVDLFNASLKQDQYETGKVQNKNKAVPPRPLS